MVVKAGFNGFPDGFDVAEVGYPAQGKVSVSCNVQTHDIGMTVHSSTLMILRHVGQKVCRIEGELFENLHVETCLTAQRYYTQGVFL